MFKNPYWCIVWGAFVGGAAGGGAWQLFQHHAYFNGVWLIVAGIGNAAFCGFAASWREHYHWWSGPRKVTAPRA